MEAAAERAIRYNACSYRSVKAILAAGLDRQCGNANQPEIPGLLPHQNIRGQAYYQYNDKEKSVLDQQTVAILNSLKLFGLARGFEERLADPKQASLSHTEFVGLLVQDEKTYRDNMRLRRLLKKAKLARKHHSRISTTGHPAASAGR